MYADSSFFVSFYLQDAHVGKTDAWMASQPSIFLTSFHRAELVHAVYQHIFRGHISQGEAQLVLANHENDRAANVWREVEVPLTQYERAIELAHRHVAKLGVRTLDTLHVAAALELGATEFWSFDERQLRLAQAVGLRTN